MDNQEVQATPAQEAVTIEDVNFSIVTLNNNIVTIGTTLLFVLSIIVGICLGKVLSLWKR